MPDSGKDLTQRHGNQLYQIMVNLLSPFTDIRKWCWIKSEYLVPRLNELLVQLYVADQL